MKTEPNTLHLSALLGEPVASMTDGVPVLASGQPLTPAQQRRIQRLLDHGVPEVIDAQAIDDEASSRIDELISPEDQLFVIASAMPAIVAELAAQRAGDPEPASYEAAKSNLALVAQTAVIRTAANTIKAQDPLPPDYLALFAAFDDELAT